MRVLVDTCAFLWLALDDEKLSPEARARCKDPYNELFLSSISIWEIGVKYNLQRLSLPSSPSSVLPQWLGKYTAEVTW